MLLESSFAKRYVRITRVVDAQVGQVGMGFNSAFRNQVQTRADVNLQEYLKTLELEDHTAATYLELASKLEKGISCLPATTTLLECVSSTVWELTNNISSQIVFVIEEINKLLPILYEAALLQRKLESVSAPNQSMICIGIYIDGTRII